MSTCVVVAESSRARFFEMKGPNVPMQELVDMVHPASRAHDQTLTSDLPGRTFDRHGQAHHAMEQEVDPGKHEAIVFSEQVADYLKEKCGKDKFERIILIAAPEFLGLLRQKLDDETKKRVYREINKNVVREDEAKIRRQLQW